MNKKSLSQRLFFNRPFAYLCLAVGVGLLCLDVVGLVVPLRNAQVYQEPRSYLIHDTNAIITAEELWRRLEHRENEPARDYVVRATEAVSDGIVFLPVGDKAVMRKYRRIPVWENYLLWASRCALALKHLADRSARASVYEYVFSDHRRAVERGVGLCGQQAAILLGVLTERNIPARLVGFSQHAVVTAEVEPGVWWVLDPSFRTVLPYDLATLRKDPDLVRAFYGASGTDQEVIDEYERFFLEPAPSIVNSIREAHGTARYCFEFLSYYLIWIIPVGSIAVGSLCLRWAGRDRSAGVPPPAWP